MADLGRGTVYRDKKNLFRADGTLKGPGFFGTLDLFGGGVATEYSIGVNFGGRETQIPTLVPSLSDEELDLMTQDIIPNRRPIPQHILNKSIEHAQ